MTQAEARKRVINLMQKYNLNKSEVMLAHLLSADVSLGDAFDCVFKSTAKDKEMACKRYLSNKPQIQILADAIRYGRGETTNSDATPINTQSINLRTKEGVLTVYEEELKSTTDIRQRIDILSKIADLQKLKNEEDKESQDLIFYYLPLRCEECPHKKAYDLRHEKEEENND